MRGLTIERLRRLVREQEEMIKLHTIWLLLGAPPLPEHLKAQIERWKESQ